MKLRHCEEEFYSTLTTINLSYHIGAAVCVCPETEVATLKIL